MRPPATWAPPGTSTCWWSWRWATNPQTLDPAGAVNGDEGGAGRHQHLLVELALGLLLRALRKGALAGRSPGVLARLDPLLPLLVRALRCRAAAVAQAALRALALLVPLPLPGGGPALHARLHPGFGISSAAAAGARCAAHAGAARGAAAARRGPCPARKDISRGSGMCERGSWD